MEAKEGRITKNHQVLWATLITLVVGIFAFAQVYIVIALNQMDDRITRIDDRITRLDNRINERLAQIENRLNSLEAQMENRLDQLTQNYIDHLRVSRARQMTRLVSSSSAIHCTSQNGGDFVPHTVSLRIASTI